MLGGFLGGLGGVDCVLGLDGYVLWVCFLLIWVLVFVLVV